MKVLKTLYNYVMRMADHPKAEWVLFAVAFVESSVFPIPPDVLLIPMVIMNLDKAFRFATICTVGSVLGGVFGYGLGYFFHDAIGMQLINFYGKQEAFAQFQEWYAEFDVYIVAVAGITPLPYKVVTIASGMLQANLLSFVMASAISRALRFFLIAWLLWRGGPEFKGWIERNLYPLTMAAGIALILLVVLIKFVFGE